MFIESISIANYTAKYINLQTELLLGLLCVVPLLMVIYYLISIPGELEEKKPALYKKTYIASAISILAIVGSIWMVAITSGKGATIHWKDIYVNKQNAISAIILAIDENENFTIEAMEAVYNYDKTLFLNKKLDKAFYAGTNTDMHLFLGDLFYNGTKLTTPNKAKASIHFVAAAKDIKTLSITCENKKWAEKYLGNPGKAWANELTFEGCDNKIQHGILQGPSNVSTDK